MPYEYDDYDFDYCKKCNELRMVHTFKFGYCQRCVSKYSLIALVGGDAEAIALVTIDYRKLMR